MYVHVLLYLGYIGQAGNSNLRYCPFMSFALVSRLRFTILALKKPIGIRFTFTSYKNTCVMFIKNKLIQHNPKIKVDICSK